MRPLIQEFMQEKQTHSLLDRPLVTETLLGISVQPTSVRAKAQRHIERSARLKSFASRKASAPAAIFQNFEISLLNSIP